MNLAKLIAFEAPDMVGKTTQSKLLVDYIDKVDKKKVIYVKAPFKTGFITFPLLYWMLDNGSAKTYPMLFQSIQYLNKILFQMFILPFLMVKYDYVIFDRWKLSAKVYGEATKVNALFLSICDSLLANADHTILLHRDALPVSRTLDSYEREIELQHLIRALYIKWFANQSMIKATIINASGSIYDVHSKIVECFNLIKNYL